MRVILLAAALMAPEAALAEMDYTDATTGLVYVLAMQGDGSATLTYAQDATEVFTLKPDCLAGHPIYGVGFWKNTGTDWQVIIGGSPFLTFTGQALPFDGVDCSKGLGDG